MLAELRQLRTAQLESLAGVLRSGRLTPPYAALALRRHITGPRVAEALAEDLQRANEAGLGPQQVAEIIALLVADRRGREEQAACHVDLVWSGPELSGVTNRDTPVVVRELFSGAEREVLVAGYAVYQGKAIFRPLAEAMDVRPDLAVTFFLDIQRPHGDTSAASEIVHRFAHRFRSQEWPGERLPDIYYDPRSLETETTKKACLHAKCIVVDAKAALVSSANFTEAAQERNIEVGVLIRSAAFARQLQMHFQVLARAGVLRPVCPS